jgi:hypothetical protein
MSRLSGGYGPGVSMIPGSSQGAESSLMAVQRDSCSELGKAGTHGSVGAERRMSRRSNGSYQGCQCLSPWQSAGL